MPKKFVIKSKRALRFDELTEELLGKKIQFFNSLEEGFWSKVGTCEKVTRYGNDVLLKIVCDDNPANPITDSQDFYRHTYTTEPQQPHRWAAYLVECEEIPSNTTNIGRASCWNCGAATEKRRDFSDMSIREFCPRCKI